MLKITGALLLRTIPHLVFYSLVAVFWLPQLGRIFWYSDTMDNRAALETVLYRIACSGSNLLNDVRSRCPAKRLVYSKSLHMKFRCAHPEQGLCR